MSNPSVSSNMIGAKPWCSSQACTHGALLVHSQTHAGLRDTHGPASQPTGRSGCLRALPLTFRA